MARALTRTLLPLDSWAKIIGIDPWSFNQFETPVQHAHQCEDVWYQSIWQHDMISREELAMSIAEAEASFAEYALFWPAPQYIVDEPLRYPAPADSRRFGVGRTRRNFMKPISLKWPYIVSGGQLNRVGMDQSPATVVNTRLTFQDTDGDGVEDQFTVSITDAYAGGTEHVAVASEIAVYFASADRNSEAISETWRIRPVVVTISSGNVTIKGHKTLLAKPSLQTPVNPEPLDPTTTGNYVNEVEVYRTYIDATATESQPYQGVALWDVPPNCDAGCAEQVRAICLGRYEPDNGIVAVSFGEMCDWPYHRQPDRLLVNYVAGYPPDAQGFMSDHMARVITYLSTALLPHEKCGCERSQRILHYWRNKPNEDTDNDRGRSFTMEEINSNPFVERNGALWAWKRIRSLMHVGGVGL